MENVWLCNGLEELILQMSKNFFAPHAVLPALRRFGDDQVGLGNRLCFVATGRRLCR